MKTPTAVAEFLINGALSFDEKLENLWYRIAQQAQFSLKENSYMLDNLSNSLKFAAHNIMQHESHQLAQTQQRLKYFSKQQIRGESEKLTMMRKKLHSDSQKRLGNISEKLSHYQKFLIASDPEQILKRGFTYTSVNGTSLSQVHELKKGDLLETISEKHLLQSKVEYIKNREKNEPKEKK
ncbi:exodeoxyribonuclease VII large subunit [Catalinimonas alkaloidigena]|uniref:exodeoxyribonuclease VII large subunit n=1 Tax=Catalinimonas alkaloidigena TaxID=1075417 RepID=UPI002406FACC|nr:exodeoxyribonuclease VII large subunit [Catalinimonas alkaloidigena]